VASTIQQELLYVGDESGKLLAIRDIIRKVCFPLTPELPGSKWLIIEWHLHLPRITRDIILAGESNRVLIFYHIN